MANNVDFVVKNGLQVSSNLVVGSYTLAPGINPITNGAIISGAVGIGTSNVTTGNSLAVYGGNLLIAGNIRISNTATQLGGIQFSDGTFQWTAGGGGTTGPTGPTNIQAYTQYDYVATTGQTTFSATYTPGYVDVYANGVKYVPSDYIATNGTSVVLNTPVLAGVAVEIIAWTVSSLGVTGPTGFTGPTGPANIYAYTKYDYTASAGQTTFTATYTVNYVDVYVNGVKYVPSDYIATNGTSVILTVPTLAGDAVEIIAWTVSSLGVTGPTGPANIYAYTQYDYTATAGQTTFTATYTPGYVDVYRNGVKYIPTDYTATNGTSIVLTNPALLGDAVEIIAWTVSSLGITGPSGPTGPTGNTGPTGVTGPANIYAYTATSFTASAGQTTFAASYTVGYVQVYQNGVKLAPADYTATNGTSIVLNVGANAGNLIEVVAWTVSSLGVTGPQNPNAVNVSNVNITTVTSNAVFYPTFVGATTGNLALYANQGISFNPATGNLNVNGNLNVAGNVIVDNTYINNLFITTTDTVVISNAATSTSNNTGALQVLGGVGISGNLFTAASAWHGNLAITNTTTSTSSTTGALTVAGGIGVGGNIIVGATGNVGIGTASIVSGNSIAIYGGNLFVAGNVRIGNTATQLGGIQFADGTFQSTAGGGGGGSLTLSNDTTTNAPRYINFTSATSGTASTLYTSNPGLLFYPLTGNVVVGGNLTVQNTAGISTFAGNVGIGTTVATTGYLLSVNGGLAATIKSFVIPHPTKPGKKLQYASLEGPENAVYIRGKLVNDSVIILPDYWTALVDADTITVHLTPISKYQKLYVASVSATEIKIANDGVFAREKIQCYYTVYAERKDVAPLSVEV